MAETAADTTSVMGWEGRTRDEQETMEQQQVHDQQWQGEDELSQCISIQVRVAEVGDHGCAYVPVV